MITGYGLNGRPLCIDCANRFGVVDEIGTDAETDLLEVLAMVEGDVCAEVRCSVPVCDNTFVVGYEPETAEGGGGRIRATVIDRGY